MAACCGGRTMFTQAAFYILVSCLLWAPGLGVRTKTKIYVDLKTQSSCFRLLNATHQTGCTSSYNGNVGILHYMQSDEDFDYVLSEGPHAPYIAIFNSADFNGTSVKRLYRRNSRVNGIMVLNRRDVSPDLLYPENGFSVADTCPNDRSGMYSNNSMYRGCKETVWNSVGTGLANEDIGVPVFSLSDAQDLDKVMNKCFNRFNAVQNASGYPLCAAELKSSMAAAVDSVTCLRRSNRVSLSLSGEMVFCDPLGDRNTHVTMLDTAQNETRPDDSVIVVGARMDSTSLFNYEYHAADTSVTGIVGLLAAMEALWKVQDTIKGTKNAKDIMFSFFQGETYDYIGSSSMVYSMQQGEFPQDLKSDKGSLHLHPINLSHVNQFVELNQVGRRDDAGSLWMHTDPANYQTAKTQIQKMTDGLQSASQGLKVRLQEAAETQPLPPASAQRFLMGRADIPTVVITDHQGEFTNKFYTSRLDLGELINATDYPSGMSKEDKYDYVTSQAEMLADVSSALARYLFEASTGVAPDAAMKQTLTANSTLVTHMLYCFLVSPNCELFKEVVDPDNVATLEQALQPFPFYVGVHASQTQVTSLVFSLTARFTGVDMNLDKDHCKRQDKDLRYTYTFMQGNLSVDGKKWENWCMKSLAQQTDALSPAFQIDDYDMMSGVYSTWTESRWKDDSINVRLFLVPSQQFQVSIFASGAVILVLSLLLVYWCNAHATHIFVPQSAGDGSPTTYSPMI